MIFAFMHEPVGKLPKSFRAKFALMRSFISVNQLVNFKLVKSSKFCLAVIAFVWRLPCHRGPVWIRLWLAKWPGWLNLRSQIPHLYGFSPVWIRLWLFRVWLWVNPLSQTSHLKGFSPVWIRIWIFKFHFTENRFSQTLHLKGFSPVWVRRCLANSNL